MAERPSTRRGEAPRLDHLVYACPDLDRACEDIAQHLGVTPAPGGRHPGRGSRNALLRLGPRAYLEVLAPDPDQPRPSSPRPFGLDHLAVPALMAWAVGVTDIDRCVAESRARGYDPGPVVGGERTTPSGDDLRWRMSLLDEAEDQLVPAVVPFLIQWSRGYHPADHAPAGVTLTLLAVAHPDPGSVRQQFRALDLAVEVDAGPKPALLATLQGPDGAWSLT